MNPLPMTVAQFLTASAVLASAAKQACPGTRERMAESAAYLRWVATGA